MKKTGLILILTAVVGAGIYLYFSQNSAKDVELIDDGAKTARVVSDGAPEREAERASVAVSPGEGREEDAEAKDEESLSDAEKQECAEEKLVDEFDAETDRWMDAEKTTPPTMDQVNAFHDKFKKLPKGRKEECLHRALNLVPDENVMLLVGILMDKSEDQELVQLVYNDVLNRDEVVKKPILQMIFKDKEHSCWADTAWILDVTGELPEKK